MKYLVLYSLLTDTPVFSDEVVGDGADGESNFYKFFSTTQALVDWLCLVSQDICLYYVSTSEDFDYE